MFFNHEETKKKNKKSTFNIKTSEIEVNELPKLIPQTLKHFTVSAMDSYPHCGTYRWQNT